MEVRTIPLVVPHLLLLPVAPIPLYVAAVIAAEAVEAQLPQRAVVAPPLLPHRVEADNDDIYRLD